MIYDIDAELLMEAMSFYKKLGYVPCSCPMIVDEDVINYTLPVGRKALNHIDDGFYVGSAEQGFLQMIKENNIRHDKMMFITPCQRDEDILDESHLIVFMKVELISLSKPIIQDVLSFYKFKNYNVDVVMTDVGYDLEINNIEVGSFGVNSFKNVEYNYGTGLALPRLNFALSVE